MNSLIQWPRAQYWDKPWNPIIGCKPCSPACENCYAAAWAKRFGQSFEPHQSSQARPPRRGVVFCGNMTDLFGDWVYHPHNNIGLVKSFANSGNATFLWLTKRVARMCDALTAFEFDDLSNHYFGFTAENQEWYNERRATTFMLFPEWANLWLSAEPLLDAIDLKQLYPTKPLPFKWVVVGCESGPKRRSCKIEWVESIVEQCRAAGVPVFVKQICLPNGKFTNKIEEFPKHLQIRQVPWTKKGSPMEANNMKAMREALEKIAKCMDEILVRTELDSIMHRKALEAQNLADGALMEPPRNCDVGTAEEQCSRLWSYCAETRCGDTLCRNGNCSLEDIRMCALRWSQMPYTEGGAK